MAEIGGEGWRWADDLRRAQSEILARLGFGPSECLYRIAAAGRHWRVRAYVDAGRGPAVLIVAAPIKRPYIWDIAPQVSAVRYGLDRGLRAYLLEWKPPRDGDEPLGLDDYADAIGAAVAHIVEAGGTKPFLMGHSLGGTFAAMFAALAPKRLRGAVLLSAPLCFRRGASPFGDALVARMPRGLSALAIGPGSLLSQVSALVAPETFIWSRLVDAAVSLHDPMAAVLHARVERWLLDEVPLPGRMVGEIEQWLYRDDRFCREALVIRDRVVGPSQLDLPTLAVVNAADDVAPPASMTHFLDAAPRGNVRVIGYGGEVGVCLQHVAALVGHKARATLWPEIIAWLIATEAV